MSINHDALQERTRGARAALWRLAGPWWSEWERASG